MTILVVYLSHHQDSARSKLANKACSQYELEKFLLSYYTCEKGLFHINTKLSTALSREDKAQVATVGAYDENTFIDLLTRMKGRGQLALVLDANLSSPSSNELSPLFLRLIERLSPEFIAPFTATAECQQTAKQWCKQNYLTDIDVNSNIMSTISNLAAQIQASTESALKRCPGKALLHEPAQEAAAMENPQTVSARRTSSPLVELRKHTPHPQRLAPLAHSPRCPIAPSPPLRLNERRLRRLALSLRSESYSPMAPHLSSIEPDANYRSRENTPPSPPSSLPPLARVRSDSPACQQPLSSLSQTGKLIFTSASPLSNVSPTAKPAPQPMLLNPKLSSIKSGHSSSLPTKLSSSKDKDFSERITTADIAKAKTRVNPHGKLTKAIPPAGSRLSTAPMFFQPERGATTAQRSERMQANEMSSSPTCESYKIDSGVS